MKKSFFHFLFNRVYSSVVRDYMSLARYLEPFISCETDAVVCNVEDEFGDKWVVTFSAGTSCQPSMSTYSIRFDCSVYFRDSDFTTTLCALGTPTVRNFNRLKFLYNLLPSLSARLSAQYSRLCTAARYFDMFASKRYDDDGLF